MLVKKHQEINGEPKSSLRLASLFKSGRRLSVPAKASGKSGESNESNHSIFPIFPIFSILPTIPTHSLHPTSL